MSLSKLLEDLHDPTINRVNTVFTVFHEVQMPVLRLFCVLWLFGAAQFRINVLRDIFLALRQSDDWLLLGRIDAKKRVTS